MEAQDKEGLVQNEFTNEPYDPSFNNFSIHAFDTADHSPKQWWWACCCPICASFFQRLEFLGENFPRDYYCFQNSFPGCKKISACKMVSEISHSIPYVCFPLEACCCPGLAIKGNREILKERHKLEDTDLENGLGIAVTVGSFFCGIYCVPCFGACMYVQQQHEYEKRSVDHMGGYKRMEED